MMADTIKNILVALDFSEPSLNALETAASLAAQWQSELSLLYVDEGLSERPQSTQKRQSMDILNALATDVRIKYAIDPRTSIVEGSAFYCIVRQAISERADLVVMGTYGASGYREGFIGTTAYNTIKLSLSPVLCVPAGRKWIPFKKMLVPVRPRIDAHSQMRMVRHFASAATVTELLSLHPAERYSTNYVSEDTNGLEDFNGKGELVYFNVDGGEGLLPDNVLKHADRSNSDLIVLTPSLDVSTKQFYIGPHTQKILHHARVPILSVNRIDHQSLY
jgi:nucleotide-binding universal stress UspA family protein